MKKVYFIVILLALCLCSALVWGYIRVLDYYLPLLLSEKSTVFEEVLPSKAEETQRASKLIKKVSKIVSKTADEAEPADEAAPEPASSIDEIVAEILRCAESLDESVTVDIKGFSDKEIADLLLASGKYYNLSWSALVKESGTVATFTPKYKISQEINYVIRTGDENPLSVQGKSVYDEARKIIGENIKDGMSDYDKALVIHDYLVKNAKYDTAAAKLVLAGKKDFPGKEDSFTAYGILLNNEGVCQAYSEAFNIFMALLGVDCEELTGDADGTPHSWNRIKLDGDYYHIDVTFDDSHPDKPGETSRAYFCLTDSMLSKEHEWEKDDIKCDSVEYNYFERNNLVVRNQEDFDRIITEAANNGEPYIEMRQQGFRVEDASLDAAARVTGLSTFRMAEAEAQGVVKVYLE